MQQVHDLPRGTFRSSLEAEGVASCVAADATVVFALSNANNDAQFYGSVLTQAMGVLHTGKAPAGSKME